FGKKAYRMALQTREQHIKRERATSNICTAQVLLAIMAGMYVVYHGPKGLRRIAEKIHGLAQLLENGFKELGIIRENTAYFDTLKILVTPDELLKVRMEAEKQEVNFRYEGENIYISLDETTGFEEISEILQIFQQALNLNGLPDHDAAEQMHFKLPIALIRNTEYLRHEVFHLYHKEHEMLRYIKRLENKDLSLVHSMIALGSCTMKLNATTEM